MPALYYLQAVTLGFSAAAMPGPFQAFLIETAARRGHRAAALAAAAASIATPAVVLLNEYVVNFSAWLPGLPPAVSNGLIPTVIFLAFVIGWYALMITGFSASRFEAVQSVFVFLIVSFAFLTMTCIWFRGHGMKLIWPL